MKKPVRSALAAALLMAAAPAFAQTFSKTVFFGDSLTDAGFYRPFFYGNVGPQTAITGKFTTNPGLVWSEILGEYYGSNGAPGWQMSPTGAYVDASGNNFAAGGARVTLLPGVPAAAPTALAPPIATQVQRYLSENGGHVDSDALYSFWAGGNDAFVFQSAIAGGADLNTELVKLMTAAGQEAAIINNFVDRGAQYTMVVTLPNGALTPSTRAQAAAVAAVYGAAAGQAVLDQAAQVTAAYNATLFGGLQDTRVIPVNTYALLGEIVASPTTYGLVNATQGACNTISAPPAGAPIPLCNPGTYAPGTPETYLWADGSGHLTSAGHRLVAQYAISLIEAPRQMALLPNAAGMVGRSRAERVAAQLTPDEADGMRWWADVRGDFQRYGHGDVYDGAGPTLTVGANWTRGNLVFGAFGGYGQQAQDWGLRGGSFDQSDASLGGFVGWKADGGLWANAQASYTQLGFDTDRTVVLGQAVRTHSASVDGSNVSFGASAGWEFGEGTLRHGPVIAVLSQKIEIDAFAENDPSLSTSLAYPEQSFDSLIGSAGWQVSGVIHEHLKPYARATWDKEFEDAPAQAFAQLQSMPGTLPYAVPGHGFDQSYGTLTFGARTQLLGMDANLGTSLTVGQERGNHATVFATVGKGF